MSQGNPADLLTPPESSGGVRSREPVDRFKAKLDAIEARKREHIMARQSHGCACVCVICTQGGCSAERLCPACTQAFLARKEQAIERNDFDQAAEFRDWASLLRQAAGG